MKVLALFFSCAAIILGFFIAFTSRQTRKQIQEILKNQEQEQKKRAEWEKSLEAMDKFYEKIFSDEELYNKFIECQKEVDKDLEEIFGNS